MIKLSNQSLPLFHSINFSIYFHPAGCLDILFVGLAIFFLKNPSTGMEETCKFPFSDPK